MSSVDDRIVNLKFNNSQFTQGVDKSKRDLTGLEQTITSAGKSKGMTQLASSADGVRTKFSALQVAGVAAFGTIVAKATNAGLGLLKSFTITPIMEGFREYQKGLESVQTIMSNTGKPVRAVNAALDELNTYADKTIYNFAEMAKNVGTFTAAGVDLDTSVQSIKGIANLAAMSGSTSQQASTAMYQLSQAISSGKVGLQDWNSVVNAGMGGKVFQTALTRTAMNMGTLTEGAVKFEGELKKLTVNGESFRTSIMAQPGKESYLTGDVLVETLKQISGGYTTAELLSKGYSKQAAKDIQKLARSAFNAATQIKTFPQLLGVIRESIGSTFATAFRTIVGDFTQSKKLWGDVGFAILGPRGYLTKIQDGFTNTLKSWAENRGRDKVLKGFKRMFFGITSVVGAFKSAFTDIFPPATGESLVNLSSAFKRFTLNLRPSKDTLEDLKNIFKGVFAVFHVGYSIIKGLGALFGNFFGALFSSSEGARGGILSLFGSFGEVLVAIDKFLTSGGRLSKFLGGIGAVAGAALSPLVAGIGFVVDAFAALISGEGLGGVKAAFSNAGDVFGGFFGKILSGLDRLTSPFDGLKSDIADFAGKAVEPFQALIDRIDAVRLKIVYGLGLDKIMPSMDGLRTLVERVKNAFVNFAESLSLPSVSMTDLGNMADWVVDKFDAMVNKIQGFMGKLDISDKVSSAKDSIAGIFSGGDPAPVTASSMSTSAASGTKAAAAGAQGAASSILDSSAIMNRAMEVFRTVSLKIGEAVKYIAGTAFDGVKAAFDGIAGAIKKISLPDDALEWASLLNVLISGALIKRLFFSKGILQQLKDTIKDMGLAAGDTFEELTNTLKTMQGSIKATIIQKIAIAVAILAAALIALALVPAKKLMFGIGAIGILMGMLSLTLKKLTAGLEDLSVKQLAKQAVALNALGTAMLMIATSVLILSVAVLALAFVPWQKLAVGLGAVGILMGMLVIAVNKLSNQSAKVAAVGAAMVLMAIAIDILVGAVVVLGLLPYDVLEQGMLAVAAGIGIMVLALETLSKDPKGISAAGLAMVLMATAINIMVGSITALGLLPWDVVEQGLKATAIGLAMMVIALGALSLMGKGAAVGAGALILMAGALLMMTSVVLTLGVAPWDVVSRGLAAMAIGLIILVGAAFLAEKVALGLLVLSVIIRAIGVALLMTGAGFLLFATGLSMIVALGVAGIAVMTLAITAFIALLPNIAIQMAAAFVSFVQAIALAAPKLRKAFGVIFEQMIGTIEDTIPVLGKLLQTMIDTGVQVFDNSVPQFVESGFNLIDKFLRSFADHVPNIVDSAVDIITSFLKEVGAHASEIGNAGLDLLVDLIQGLEDAIENSNRVRDAAYSLVRTFGDEVREAAGEILGGIDLLSFIPGGNMSKDVIAKLLNKYGGDAGAPGSTRDADLDTSIAKTSQTLAQAIVDSIPDLIVLIQGMPVNLSKQAASTQADATRQATEAESMSESASETEANASDLRSAADDAAAKQKEARDAAKAAKKEFEKKKQKAKEKQKNKKASEKANKKLDAANKKARNTEAAAAKAEGEATRQAEAARLKSEQAAATQRKADFEAKKLSDEQSFNDSDFTGKGDVMSSRADDLVSQANALQAQAQAKADEASRLEALAAAGGKNAAKYRQQAAQLRKEATAETAESMMLANEAIEAQARAVAAYAAARKEAAETAMASIADLKKQQEETAAQRAWDNKYEDASDADKIAMLQTRVTANTAKANAAQEALNAAYGQSEALAAQIASDPASVTDAQVAAVEKALADAQVAASAANSALDSVEQDMDTIQQLQESITGAANAQAQANSSGNGLTPSRSALDDAALAVDRYTSSVAQAEIAATSEQGTVQFVQNNYSPESLSASKIYRQTKNLTSTAGVKMGVN